LRLLVVSHPAVLAVNQLPYAELRRHGWDPYLVTPSRWRNEYTHGWFPHEVLPELSGRVAGRRVALLGSIQRHFYLTAISEVIEQVRPAAAFIEQEPTAVSSFQWGRLLRRAGVPYGVQAAENLDRPYPLVARALRRWTLANAAFAAARSPAAAELVRSVRPGVRAPVVPHHVPAFPPASRPPQQDFVIGYAGRLVPEKGIDVLIDAAAVLDQTVVRLVGNGPHRAELEALATARSVRLEIDSSVKHEQMAAAYATFDVLVLPSRTTPRWAEQFGRVLVEASSCGVPVVGSDSGEIPWVIGATGGGLVVPEGDVAALRDVLIRLRDSTQLRGELGTRGREQAQERFSVAAVAGALHRALTDAAQHRVDGSASSA